MPYYLRERAKEMKCIQCGHTHRIGACTVTTDAEIASLMTPRSQPEKDNENRRDDNKDEHCEFLRMPFGLKMAASVYSRALATAGAPKNQPEEDKESKRDNDNSDDNKELDDEPTEVLD